MLGLIRSEAIKLFSARTTWIYGMLTLLALFLPAFSYRFFVEQTDRFTLDELLLAGTLGVLITMFGGAMIVGTDISRKTVAWSYLVSNARVTQMAVQIVLLVGFFLGMAAVGFAVAVGIHMILGTDITFTWSQVGATAISLIFTPVLAALLTRILNSAVFATMILVADMLIIETLLRSLPSEAAHKIADILPFYNIALFSEAHFDGATHGREAAAMILVATIAVAAVAAATLVRRRPIS